jgi:hypothetical protein
VRKRNTAKESLLTNILSKSKFFNKAFKQSSEWRTKHEFWCSNIPLPIWPLHSENKASKVALKLRTTYITETDLDEKVTSMLYKQ